MKDLPFIFSDEPRMRIRRHLAFWACWWLFQAFLYSFIVGFSAIDYARRLPISALESALFLVSHMFLAYALIYGVIPRLLVRGRYFAAAAATLALFVATGALSAGTALYIVVPLRKYFFADEQYIPHINEVHFFLGLLAGLRGAITIGGLAAAIKLTKYWYQKEQRNMQLQKEALEAQSQLLKAQVHPHFLFNTLNNIYAHTHVGSPVAAEMIGGLSDLLRYMLYEGSNRVVPLRKELRMLEDYLLLEAKRYGNRLDLGVDLPADTEGLYIAPLLLLPYVENCFKHGASQLVEQPWISLQISVDGDTMKMKLVNAKPAETDAHPPGIGLENVRRRLELLYPARHELQVTDSGELFIVNLKLQLERQSEPAAAASLLQPAYER